MGFLKSIGKVFGFGGGGGGGGQAYKKPESEKASQAIESARYQLAAGFNKQYLPRYVSESRRDLSAQLAGRANADSMKAMGNQYIGNANPFQASTSASALANARNTAIIKAYGLADKNRTERTDSALSSLNGQASDAAGGLLSQASRQSEEAIQKATNEAAHKAMKYGAIMSLVTAAGGIGLDQYQRKKELEKQKLGTGGFWGLPTGSRPGDVSNAFNELYKLRGGGK